MAQISKYLLVFFIFVCFAACTKYSFEIKPVVEIPDVSYSQDVQPVFDAKCVKCHSGTTPPDLRQGNSYKSLVDGGYVILPAEDSKLNKAVTDNLHASFTTQEEKSIIYSWILQGAKDN